MFEYHCKNCDIDFDVYIQLKESDKMGTPLNVNFCSKCGEKRIE